MFWKLAKCTNICKSFSKLFSKLFSICKTMNRIVFDDDVPVLSWTALCVKAVQSLAPAQRPCSFKDCTSLKPFFLYSKNALPRAPGMHRVSCKLVPALMVKGDVHIRFPVLCSSQSSDIYSVFDRHT